MQSAVPVRRPPAWCPGPQRWFDRTSRRANGCAPSSPAQRPATRMQPFHPSATIARIARVGRWHAALRPAGRRARGRGAGPGAGPAAAAAASASGPAWPGPPHRPAVARAAPGPAQESTGRPQGRARRWFLQRAVEGQGAWGPWRGIGSGGYLRRRSTGVVLPAAITVFGWVAAVGPDAGSRSMSTRRRVRARDRRDMTVPTGMPRMRAVSS